MEAAERARAIELANNTCNIEFRIKYRVTNDDQSLAILGNVSCLGEWKPELAVEAILRNEEWVVSFPTPRDSAFEWKWMVMDRRKRVVIWEERRDRLSIIRHSGVLFCIWNQADDPEVLHVQHDHLVMSTTYNTVTGQSLFVVGSLQQFGSWEAERGLRAVEKTVGSGLWVVEVVLDRYRQVEWKWVVVDAELRALRWEERENRVITPGEDRRQIYVPWNGEEMGIYVVPLSTDITSDEQQSSTSSQNETGRNQTQSETRSTILRSRNYPEDDLSWNLSAQPPRISSMDSFNSYYLRADYQSPNISPNSANVTPGSQSPCTSPEILGPNSQCSDGSLNNPKQDQDSPHHPIITSEHAHTKDAGTNSVDCPNNASNENGVLVDNVHAGHVNGANTEDNETSMESAERLRDNHVRYFRSLDNHELSPLRRMLGLMYDLAALPFRIVAGLWITLFGHARAADARM